MLVLSSGAKSARAEETDGAALESGKTDSGKVAAPALKVWLEKVPLRKRWLLSRYWISRVRSRFGRNTTLLGRFCESGLIRVLGFPF